MLVAATALALVGSCTDRGADSADSDAACGTVDAARYDAFWLWAGVKPQPVLERAKRLYLLEGEVVGNPGRWVNQRGGTPRLGALPLYLVVRVETLDWEPETETALFSALRRWKQAGNNVVGVQIDFDARTRKLDQYADFLKQLRTKLPQEYQLSVTGLLDWSANADSEALNALGSTVDEVVLQTYQGRATVSGYEQYLKRLSRLKLPFRLGVVQGGKWCPRSIAKHPQFKGYVVFLVNPPPS